MKNIMAKIDAETLQRIVERHINESLAQGSQARITTISGTTPTEFRANLPNHELMVQFDVAPVQQAKA